VALFLYGSHARGDADETSDVDILQVTIVPTAPYAIGRFNVTCYTLDQLLEIARTGGLFARHVVSEAVPLSDSEGLLEILKSAYAAPDNYDDLRAHVYGCAPLLDVEESEFLDNANGLSSLVSYLVRTHLYATAFDQGARSFAMQHIIEVLGHKKARAILSNVKDHTFPAFVAARQFFKDLTGVICQRQEESVEAFIVNASAQNPLAMILGLRLLARGRLFTYDVLRELEL
jgi:predicted nucleotidyltransferase